MTCEIGSPVSFARVLPVWEAGVGWRWAWEGAGAAQCEGEGSGSYAPSWAALWLSHPWPGWRCDAGGGRPSPPSSTGGTARNIMLAHAHTRTGRKALGDGERALRALVARRPTFIAGYCCVDEGHGGGRLSLRRLRRVRAHCTASVSKGGTWLGAALKDGGRSEGTDGLAGWRVRGRGCL